MPLEVFSIVPAYFGQYVPKRRGINLRLRAAAVEPVQFQSGISMSFNLLE